MMKQIAKHRRHEIEYYAETMMKLKTITHEILSIMKNKIVLIVFLKRKRRQGGWTISLMIVSRETIIKQK